MTPVTTRNNECVSTKGRLHTGNELQVWRIFKPDIIGIVQNKDWTCGLVDSWTHGLVDSWTRNSNSHFDHF